MPGITQQSKGEQGLLQPPAELLIFLLPRLSPRRGGSPPFEGGGINKHNSRKPHTCSNAAGKSPWLPLPTPGCSSAKPMFFPKTHPDASGIALRAQQPSRPSLQGRGAGEHSPAGVCKSLCPLPAARLRDELLDPGPARGKGDSHQPTLKMRRL